MKTPSAGRRRSPRRPARADTPAEPHRVRGALHSRFATALHRLTGRTALASRLSRAVGRRHATYIRKMREMFESGDLDSALRHAIPLAAEAGPRRLPLRAFAPRADLHIRPERSRPWSVGEISPDLHGELRRLYREAFHRLESQERVEEAAFLLAEVLHDHEEAVSFLERHGRLRLAAEMAEARDLAPGLVVRQWFLAGDRQRGLRIAHRAGAFADAVARLERSREMEQAAELRRLWARELAAAGDYAAAVDTLWPLEEERHRALEWMDRAIEQGERPPAACWPARWRWRPSPSRRCAPPASMLLESWRAEGAPARLAFADALRRGPRGAGGGGARPRRRARHRPRFRAARRPHGAAPTSASSPRSAGDGALRTDALALPLPARTLWIARGEPWQVEIAARDAGTMAAYDAAFLPNGLTAVALGEARGAAAGARRAGGGRARPAGAAARRLPTTATARSPSPAGGTPGGWRGSTSRCGGPSPGARRASTPSPRTTTAPSGSSPAPDGLLAAETAGKRLDGAWGVSRLPGSPLAIARSEARCSLLLAGHDSEVWTYELPSLTLRRREPVTIPPGTRRTHRVALSPEGALAEPSPGRRARAGRSSSGSTAACPSRSLDGGKAGAAGARRRLGRPAHPRLRTRSASP